MPEGGSLIIIVSIALLVFSAFFSSSEAAFLSVQRTRLSHMVNMGVPGAKRVEEMIDKPERLLSTILLGNNLVNVAFASIMTLFFVGLFEEGQEGTGVLVATAVGTGILLIVGEIVPKTIAVHHPERIAFLYARPLKGVEYLMLPIVVILDWTTHRLNTLLGGANTRESITEGELRTLIDIGEAEGTFEPAEAEMLENVFRFGDRQVREVMTPRTEIVSLGRGATLREFLSLYSLHSHTRFPVYRDDEDNVIGIISSKDILKAMSTRGIGQDDSVTDVIRDALFMPETKLISELFDEMRHSGNQMAILVDEYGGLSGLVTLKRLVEEVVGPVGEEGEAPEEEYEAIDENTFQVDGGMSIEEVNEELGITLPDGEYETVAGFVLDVLGHIPAEGEQFEYGNLKFEVLEMSRMKIESVRLVKAEVVESEAIDETDSSEARRD
ncbi:MAG: HlyC/CorC family transporter [Chloroflexi bacterium]|nr:HlyC/CorC family transporter [Chloroflexota bacterium]